MAISDYLVPLADDDELLGQLRAYADDGTRPPETFWDRYARIIDDAPRAIDMWRLGIEINDALAVGLDTNPREFIWTDGAFVIDIEGGFFATFLPPLSLRALVDSLAPVTRVVLETRITTGSGTNVSREELIDWTADVLDTMRWAADEGLGLLRDSDV